MSCHLAVPPQVCRRPRHRSWHTDNFIWLIRQFGGRDALMESPLVLPKPGFFRSDGEEGHALALRLFEQVKAYCGMADWEVDLVPDENPWRNRANWRRGWLRRKSTQQGRLASTVTGSRSPTVAQLRRPPPHCDLRARTGALPPRHCRQSAALRKRGTGVPHRPCRRLPRLWRLPGQHEVRIRGVDAGLAMAARRLSA